MDNFKNLWQPYDDKKSLLWTKIPNCLLLFLMQGKQRFTEIRIILLICRMGFGFKREETNYLDLKDFEKATGLNKSQASKAINSLLSAYVIFRYSKNGNKYKYAVNLLKHGIEMKHFRIGKMDSQKDNGIYQIGNIDYQLDNYNGSKNELILYSSKGYKNVKNPYIKEDRKDDIKIDIAKRHASSPVSSSPTSNTLTGNASQTTKSKKYNNTMELAQDFDKELYKANIEKDGEKLLIRFIELEHSQFPDQRQPWLIPSIYCDYTARKIAGLTEEMYTKELNKILENANKLRNELNSRCSELLKNKK
ncbi:MAG TPA: hypothetical protein PL155_07775 [Candidatus Omnitrophota bacterium]|nr:hypothetical protein [Candidatus Omnitrophota bacterium]HPD85267.1 hypothetical protein [Candidatus Omnitrophota bacterium]HRZ04232.1 hypothetical protein [Candidatus Omnitrophota bacterium]